MGVHAKREFNCPVDATISLIGGKYKAVILWHLKGNTLRYSELHREGDRQDAGSAASRA